MRMSIKRFIALMTSFVLVFGLTPISHAQAADSSKPKADIVFVIDSTGSMTSSIQNVVDSVGDFVSALEKSNVDMRISIVEYRDITVDGNESTKVHSTSAYSPWFNTASDVKAELNTIYADGGGDTPETLIDALGYVSKGDVKFRSDAHKFVFVITDAGYKANNTHGYQGMSGVVNELSSQGIVISIITDSEYFDDSYNPGDSEDDDAYDAMSALSLRAESVSSASDSGAMRLVAATIDTQASSTAEKDTSQNPKKRNETKMSLLAQSTVNAAYEISAGDSISVKVSGEDSIVKFVPSKSGIYSFYSTSDTYDTVVSLLNSEGTFLYSDDDGGSGDNFKLRAKLRAGVTYYYSVGLYYDSDEATIPVSLSLDQELIEGTYSNMSYRDIANQTNGILADIDGSFSSAMSDLANRILSISLNSSRKAIYVLPGYMGSQLYKKGTYENVWVNVDYLIDDVFKYTLPFGDTSILLRDENGGSGKVTADLTQDKYGSQDKYKKLIDKLNEEFSDEYDVIFFGYDWLGDLSEEAARLENHIKSNRYDEVILITHSTGGLLASNFIARSDSNKRLVSKAILVAPPLYGTYTALLPIETGKTDTSDKMLADNGVSGIKLSFVHPWIQGVTKNSPVTYQLFPSEEYLKSTAIIYKDDMGGRAVTSSNEYYDILNRSGNINPNLTNGNQRSHSYFRNTILHGDIVKTLQGVDTVILGSSRGNNTPAIAKYSTDLFGQTHLDVEDIVYKQDGDGTVMGFSAFAMKDGKTHVLNYRDYPGISHGGLVEEDTPLSFICSYINSSKVTTSSISDVRSSLMSQSEDDGMSSQVKFLINSNCEIDVCVFDQNGTPIDLESYSDSDFTFQPLAQDSENAKYRYLLYVPNQGWKVDLYTKDYQGRYDELYNLLSDYGASPEDMGVYLSAPDGEVQIKVDLSTLDADGFNTATASYSKTIESITSSMNLASFNLTADVNPSNIGTFENSMTSSVQEGHNDWEINEDVVFDEIGATETLNLNGQDVDDGHVAYSNLVLTSSNPNVVSVSNDGSLKAEGYGFATISAYSPDSGKISQCSATVKLLAKSISIEDAKISIGERFIPSPTFDSDEVTSTELYLTSNDTDIVQVADNGVLIGLKPGKARINAVAEGGASTSFEVTVFDNQVINVNGVSLNISSATINLGSTGTITATITPSNATNKQIEWHVSSNVLQVVKSNDSECTVKGVAAGKAKVYAVTSDGGYTNSIEITVQRKSIDGATISGLTAKTYTGKALTPAPTVKLGGSTLKSGTDYTVAYKNNKKVGTATVTVTGKGNYTGTKSATFKINKANQPMTVKAAAKKVKLATVKKKAVAVKKAITVKKNQGKASYKNVSTTKKLKKFKVNAKNGTITVPKGTKKGTYKVKVKVTAKGNANYKSGSKTVTINITVK